MSDTFFWRNARYNTTIDRWPEACANCSARVDLDTMHGVAPDSLGRSPCILTLHHEAGVLKFTVQFFDQQVFSRLNF